MDTDFSPLRTYIQQFTPLTDEDWALLLPYLNFQTVRKGENFAREGKVAKTIGYIISGTMRHYYTLDGEEKTTYFYFENMMVGAYFSCITGQPSQMTIEALSDTELIVFPFAAMSQLYNKSPAWERFGRLLAEYLALGLEERMVGLLILSPEQRYMQLLESNKQRILERIPQHYIANYLGITAVSLSRIRNRLLKNRAT